MRADINYTIRTMKEEDYEQVIELWRQIPGFALRSIDDSYEGIARFIERNPRTSIVAVMDGKLVGTVLAGHDGREGRLYHVCVAKPYRKNGIGKSMVTTAMLALQRENINKVTLIAFDSNQIGNDFWRSEGWRERVDVHSYELVLNDQNIVEINAAG